MMQKRLLHPAQISPSDTDEVLRQLNAAQTAMALAQKLGLGGGPEVGRLIADNLLLARRKVQGFTTLSQVMDTTGVTALLFTEIVIALSSTNLSDGIFDLQFLPVNPVMWLGQSINLGVQLLDSKGHGLTKHRITCIADTGQLSARDGPDQQPGRTVRLLPEPGGLINLSFASYLMPTFTPSQASALTVELARLDAKTRTPAEAAKQLRQVATQYRQQGARALRGVLDQLFDLYPPPPQPATLPWPSHPVTLLALVEDDTGQVRKMATLHLSVRNWLGGFHMALRDEIGASSPLANALDTLGKDIEAGRDISRQIILAKHGFAGIERGKLGRDLRDQSAGRDINAYLETNARALTPAAITNASRAAGASQAALAAGGFAVFDAVRNASEVQDTISPVSKLDFIGKADLAAFGNRLDMVERDAVKRGDLDQLSDALTGDFTRNLNRLQGKFSEDQSGLNARLGSLEESALGKDDLAQFQLDFDTKLDDRFKEFEGKTVAHDDFKNSQATLDERLGALEAETIRKDDLTKLERDLTLSFDARFETLGRDFVKRSSLDALKSELSEEFETRLKIVEEGSISRDEFNLLREDLKRDTDTRLAGTVSQAKLDENLDEVIRNFDTKMARKANASSLSQLKTSFAQIEDKQTLLQTRMNDLGTINLGDRPLRS
jgi:hypothetical protein